MALSNETYQLLIDAYRRWPADHGRAARVAGCSRAQASAAWGSGEGGRRAIGEVIGEEQAAARGALENLRAEVRAEVTGEGPAVKLEAPSAVSRLPEPPRGGGGSLPPGELAVAAVAKPQAISQQMKEAIRADAIRARTQEAQLVRMVRSNVLALSNVSTELLRGVGSLAVKVRVHVESAVIGPQPKGGATDGLPRISLDDAVSLISRMSGVVRNAAHAGQLAIEMERDLLGTSDPSTTNESGDMTLEAAMQELEAVNREFEEARSNPSKRMLDVEGFEGTGLRIATRSLREASDGEGTSQQEKPGAAKATGAAGAPDDDADDDDE